MEPISAVALSLALGAGAVAGKELVSGLVKDAYTKLKELVGGRYPNVSVDHLEQAPESKARRASVEEELSAANAGEDVELVAAARKLMELIQEQAPSVAAAIGVDLKDVEAANLRLADIAASGTGVRVEKGRFTGDIEISGVRAGQLPGSGPSPAPANTPRVATAVGVQLNQSVVHGNVVLLETALARADSSLDELCDLLDYRADKATRMLSPSVVDEFGALHIRHINALRNGQLVLAHDVLNEIQEFMATHNPGKHIRYFTAPPKHTQLTYGEEYSHLGGLFGLLGGLFELPSGRHPNRQDRTPEAIAIGYSGLVRAIKDERHGG